MMKFLIVLLIGLAIYIVFRVARLLLAKPGNHRWRSSSMILVPVEMVIWTAFFFWAVERLFSERSYYGYVFTTLLLVGFGFLAWFYLKEVVAGAFFKVQHNPRTGRHLHLGNLEGVIKRISATHLSLDTPEGDNVKVPFSRLVTNVFSLGVHKEQARDFRFKFKLDKRWEKDETIKRIRTALILSPYCSFKEPVDIRIEDEDTSSYSCEIAVRPLSQDFEGKIEKGLRKAMDSAQ